MAGRAGAPIRPMIASTGPWADAEAERAVDRDSPSSRTGAAQRLGRQHVLDLAGADAEGERAERAVRGGVAVAADQGRARQGETLLGADDMDDPLRPRRVGKIGNCEIGDIGFPGLRAGPRFLGRRLEFAGRRLDTRGVVGRLWSAPPK
jgi:hypothetical protein